MSYWQKNKQGSLECVERLECSLDELRYKERHARSQLRRIRNLFVAAHNMPHQPRRQYVEQMLVAEGFWRAELSRILRLLM